MVLSKKTPEISKSNKVIEDENTRVEGEEERTSFPGREFSQRIIKKVRLREMSTNPKKKSVQVR